MALRFGWWLVQQVIGRTGTSSVLVRLAARSETGSAIAAWVCRRRSARSISGADANPETVRSLGLAAGLPTRSELRGQLRPGATPEYRRTLDAPSPTDLISHHNSDTSHLHTDVPNRDEDHQAEEPVNPGVSPDRPGSVRQHDIGSTTPRSKRTNASTLSRRRRGTRGTRTSCGSCSTARRAITSAAPVRPLPQEPGRTPHDQSREEPRKRSTIQPRHPRTPAVPGTRIHIRSRRAETRPERPADSATRRHLRPPR